MTAGPQPARAASAPSSVRPRAKINPTSTIRPSAAVAFGLNMHCRAGEGLQCNAIRPWIPTRARQARPDPVDPVADLELGRPSNSRPPSTPGVRPRPSCPGRPPTGVARSAAGLLGGTSMARLRGQFQVKFKPRQNIPFPRTFQLSTRHPQMRAFSVASRHWSADNIIPSEIVSDKRSHPQSLVNAKPQSTSYGTFLFGTLGSAGRSAEVVGPPKNELINRVRVVTGTTARPVTPNRVALYGLRSSVSATWAGRPDPGQKDRP